MLSPRAWADLETFLLTDRDLCPTTTAKILGRLRCMQREGVNLARPTRAQYRAFMARKKRLGETGPGLRHYPRSLKHLLMFHGTTWGELRLPRAPSSAPRLIPDPVAHQLLHYRDDGRGGVHVDDAFADQVAGAAWEREVQTARFAFNVGFYVAPRTPSEIYALQEGDYDRDTRELTINSQKTRKRRRLLLEPWLGEKFEEWLDGPRAEIARRATRALIPDPRTGRDWPSPDALRMELGRHARTVDAQFSCKQMRTWGLVWRCIQWDLNILLVKEWAGHEAIGSTMYYVRIAENILRARMVAAQVQPLSVTAAAPAPASRMAADVAQIATKAAATS